MQCRKMAFANFTRQYTSFLRPSGHKKSERTSYDVDATITPHRRRYDATIAPCIGTGLFIKSCPRLHAEQTAYCNTTIIYRKPERFDNFFFIFRI